MSQTAAETTNGFPFRITSVIKAERAEYSFRVFLHKNQDSTLIAERTRIVCGDVYVIYGQSNALALPGLDDFYSLTFDDKYLRNCAFTYGSTDINWYPAKQPYGSVGGFGLTLQRLILQKYGIPTLVLNGAQGGQSLAVLARRDAANPTSLGTYYGQLLYRARWAGVADNVKAIIWKQGEEDAGAGTLDYPQQFAQFYANLRRDYGEKPRLYVGQINILANREDVAAQIRDFQRRTKYLFPNVETIATVGTPGYDGVHYNPYSHQQLANEQFRQIARDYYGSADTVQINSPDVKKVFYNAAKDSINLVFDAPMVWQADTATFNPATGTLNRPRYLKDYFYLDGQPGLVAGGSASGNRVVLRLSRPATARTIRYLPAYFSDPPRTDFYDGPTLTNPRGMRAFSFDNVLIADAIPLATITARAVSDKQIQLTWTAPAGAGMQFLERAVGTPTNFTQVAALSGAATTFSDTDLPDLFGTYYYRLRSISATSESGYSSVAVARPLVLSIEPVDEPVKIYPNPVTAGVSLHIDASPLLIKALVLRDAFGRTVKTGQTTAQSVVQLFVDELPAGVYVADLQTTTGQTLRRKVVIR